MSRFVGIFVFLWLSGVVFEYYNIFLLLFLVLYFSRNLDYSNFYVYVLMAFIVSLFSAFGVGIFSILLLSLFLVVKALDFVWPSQSILKQITVFVLSVVLFVVLKNVLSSLVIGSLSLIFPVKDIAVTAFQMVLLVPLGLLVRYFFVKNKKL